VPVFIGVSFARLDARGRKGAQERGPEPVFVDVWREV
jgi:hypothetical protein